MRTILRSWILIATIVVTDAPAAASEPETLARVSVVFVKPEGCTDAGYSKTERNLPAILLQLQRFIFDTAARHLPESMRLEVKITDIDLAGDFELFRGPQFDHVPVTKSIYPRRIALEFRVVDAGDQTIKEGQRQLTDVNYQLHVDYPREDPLRYEKEILRDWLRGELSVLHAGKAG
jgi:Protein of unknown function (DUF3016)